MSETRKRAEKLIELLGPEVDVNEIKEKFCSDKSDWFRISAKAYQIHLSNARRQRQKDEITPHIICTTNSEIRDIIKTNDELADYALCLPAMFTMSEYRTMKSLLSDMPKTEIELLSFVEVLVLDPHLRVSQKKGRFEHFAAFKAFVKHIDAATLCYFRGNYLSSYMTLVPVVEGIMLRWAGYDGEGKKPEFEDLRKFFSQSHVRQPCPGNPLFHEVYSKVCDKILNEHLYKSLQNGTAHPNFNRHLAAHLLNNSQFATKENCARLLLLIDVMSELYHYETYCEDPRRSLSPGDISTEVLVYTKLRMEHKTCSNPEQLLLGGISEL